MDALEVDGDLFGALGGVETDDVVSAPPGRFSVGDPVAIRVSVHGIHEAHLGHAVLALDRIPLDEVAGDHAGGVLAEEVAEPLDAVGPQPFLLAQPGDGVEGRRVGGAGQASGHCLDPVAPVGIVTEDEQPERRLVSHGHHVAPGIAEVAVEHLQFARQSGVLPGVAHGFGLRAPAAKRLAVEELVPEDDRAAVADAAMAPAPGCPRAVHVDDVFLVGPAAAPVRHGGAGGLHVGPEVLEILGNALAVEVLGLDLVRLDPVRWLSPVFGAGDDVVVRRFNHHADAPLPDAPPGVLRASGHFESVELRHGAVPGVPREVHLGPDAVLAGHRCIELGEGLLPCLLNEGVVLGADHSADVPVVNDAPLLAIFQAQDGGGDEDVVGVGLEGRRAEAPEGDKVCLEHFGIRGRPVSADAGQGFGVVPALVSRPGPQRRAGRDVNDILALSRPPLHRAALVADGIRSAFLPDGVSAHPGHELGRILQVSVVVVFLGDRTAWKGKQRHANQGVPLCHLRAPARDMALIHCSAGLFPAESRRLPRPAGALLSERSGPKEGRRNPSWNTELDLQ